MSLLLFLLEYTRLKDIVLLNYYINIHILY